LSPSDFPDTDEDVAHSSDGRDFPEMGKFRGAALLFCAGEQDSPVLLFKFSSTGCLLPDIAEGKLLLAIL
jgi:hypothetical protein